MNIKHLFKTNNKIAYMKISSNYYPNRYLFIPMAMDDNNKLEPLSNYDEVRKKPTDKELGELVIKSLEKSKRYRKKDLISNLSEKNKKLHNDFLRHFEQINIHVNVILDYEKNEYTVQKEYGISQYEYEVSEDDPIHNLSGDISLEELGKTIYTAFFDVGTIETKKIREKGYCQIEINRNINNNKIFIRPFGFGHLGLLTSLYDYIIVDESVDDYNLGKLAIEYLNKAKESIGKNISIKPEGYDKKFKEQNIEKLLRDSHHLSVLADYKNENYRIEKSYSLSRNKMTRKKDDPEHLLPIDASYELLGRTIREAFDDVSTEGKTM